MPPQIDSDSMPGGAIELAPSVVVRAPKLGKKEQANARSNVTMTEMKNVGLTDTIRNVRDTRSITGEEFNTLSLWLFICSFVFNGAVCGVMFYFFSFNSHFADDDNTIVLYVTLGVLCLVLLEVALTAGYCLIRRNAPLLKCRVRTHMFINFLMMVIVVLVAFPISVDDLGIANLPEPVRIALLGTQSLAVSIAVASQVARQRLIYVLFGIGSRINQTEPKWAYGITLIFLCSTSILTMIPFVFLYKFEDGRYRDWSELPITILSILYVCLLLVYTYLTHSSQGVNESYSDWRSNVRVGLVLTMAILFSCAAKHGFTRAFKESNFLLLPTYVALFTVAVVILDIFGTVALITAMGYELKGRLDPQRTKFSSSHHALPEDKDRRKSRGEISMYSEHKLNTVPNRLLCDSLQIDPKVMRCSDENTIDLMQMSADVARI
ncbi:hypothetical protein SARC_11359 [Sphaeroforma arctica JP610]|uniref:Uncharacterized protein n=1 Tax=Sphaeroforma arctica JP610 TaxID=667725 RepID=A0A0L0FH79_9EUKA|nr:hypothetical protein SARC_11359 [Sphaeroforma arctica JP610]KNC76129.1 hypothetical protein SARC_11359 [Sphaeroforma arctica JP610]|eukprot:XP_014150031.1 hypothetical protein SARC_11359 [Sphaeroforma arctica JP610]